MECVGIMQEKALTSPLQYPGAKHWLLQRILDVLPDETQAIVSPFFGGGSLELNLALRGIRVHGYDLFQPVVNFWQHYLSDTASVVADATAILNLYDSGELQNLKRQRYPEICYHGMDAASLYYVFNRLGFCGAPSSHVRPFALRYDGHYVRDWHDRKNGRRVFTNTEFWESVPTLPISVERSDFTESLARHPDLFAFCDPPYPSLKTGLYGDSREYHEKFDHIALYDILKARKMWGLTYNDVPFVRDLYKYFEMIPVERPSSWGKREEVLILSHDLAEQMWLSPIQLTHDFSAV